MSPKRVIAHLDCDAFYATVELIRRPELKGKPVIVAGSGPRAVVTTASYEARKFGVGSAMPASRARRLCPAAVVIPPDFTSYRETSKAVWAIVGERLDRLQPMGLDEAYADLTGVPKPLRVLRELIDEVRDKTGITISAGVGPSRLVAKCCSDHGKPAGLVAMGREEACERFATAPTSRVPGIGPKTADRLAELGLRTIGQLQRADEGELAARFGSRTARFLKARAEFHDDSPVETERGAAKSRSNETTFDTDISDLDELESVLRRLSAELCEGLVARGRRGRTIAIKVRLDDWTTVTRARSVEAPTNDVKLVTEVALELLRAYAPPKPVRLLGVRLASFEDVRSRHGRRPRRRWASSVLAALVQRGGELAARLARHGVLDAELVQHADHGAAQVVAPVGVALGGDRGDQPVEAGLEVPAVERRERVAERLVVLEAQARGEAVGGEGAGHVGQHAPAPRRGPRARRAAWRAGRRRRRGPARAPARGAGWPRRRPPRAPRPRRARGRRGTAPPARAAGRRRTRRPSRRRGTP